ncbi:MAG: MBL fold metallo-hydrolase [Gammaproteobacteria bacterium]|nr:MBL fold metallo-hydrolase [Gammaproteobacteria bacterium]
MRFASLGSGSRGNAMLIEAGATRILLDSGFAAREVESRLGQIGVEPDSIDAIVVTHEHQDHIRGVGAYARRYRLPVWITAGTNRQNRCGVLPEVRLFNPHESGFHIGDLEVTPFPVPHDATEPSQFVFAAGGLKLGILTDIGFYTPHISEMLQACDALFLECNHDVDMLASGPYPPALQRRVASNLGHLSNDQAVDFLRQFDLGRLQRLVAAHLSEKNNTPDLARRAMLSVAENIEDRLSVAGQDEVSELFEIS